MGHLVFSASHLFLSQTSKSEAFYLLMFYHLSSSSFLLSLLRVLSPSLDVTRDYPFPPNSLVPDHLVV